MNTGKKTWWSPLFMLDTEAKRGLKRILERVRKTHWRHSLWLLDIWSKWQIHPYSYLFVETKMPVALENHKNAVAKTLLI